MKVGGNSVEIKYVKYHNKYFNQCAMLMKGTWNFHKHFVNIENNDIVYGAFLEGSLMDATYTDLILDEHENVLGYLIGNNYKKDAFFIKGKKLLGQIKFYSKHLIYLILGKYGDKKAALQQFSGMTELASRLEKDKMLFDSEVNLFFVSPILRGKGYGKKLMDRYIEYCKQREIKKVFLWTDRGCNYKFYEFYGFELHDQINHKLLAEPEKEYNGFVYSLNLNK